MRVPYRSTLKSFAELLCISYAFTSTGLIYDAGRKIVKDPIGLRSAFHVYAI
jgi:hypothetical protein